jgi:hypothetical protein
MRGRYFLLAFLIMVCALGTVAYRLGGFAEVGPALGRYWRDLLGGGPSRQRSGVVASEPFSGGRPWPGDQREVKRGEQSLALRGENRIVVENDYGHFFLTGREQNTIDLKIVKWGYGKTRAEQIDHSDAAQLQFLRAGRDLKLTIIGPPDYAKRSQIDLYLTVPHNFSLRGKSINGNFHVEGLKGDIALSTVTSKIEVSQAGRVKADTVNGELVVDHASGPVNLKTKSGQITLTAIGKGLTAQNVGGHIWAYDVGGPVDLSTLSGEIIVDKLGGENRKLRTTSGDIAALVAGGRAGRLKAESVSGSIRLIVPAEIDCRVALDTARGELRNTLPLKDRSAKPGHLQGRAGEGRGELRVSTGSGDLSLEVEKVYPGDLN